MATFSGACKTIHASPSPKQHNHDSGPNDCVTNEPVQIFASELNLMEMNEVEYKHLQHIIQTHMEAQGLDPGKSDARFQNNVFTLGSLTSQPVDPEDDAESVVIYPYSTTQAIDLSTSTDEQYAVPNDLSQDETVTVQETKMVLAGDAVGVLGERTPNNCGEAPGSVPSKIDVTWMEAPVNSGSSLLTRAHPPARVCLEKRFNFSPDDIPRQRDVQTGAVSNFLAIYHQSKDAEETDKHPQMQKCMKSDQTNSIELSQTYRGGIFKSFAGMRRQALGTAPQMIEPIPNKSVIITKNISFSTPSERVAPKCQTISTDSTEDQPSVTVENDTVVKPAASAKCIKTRGLRSLKASHSAPDSKEGKTAETSIRRKHPPLDTSQRRERHNINERDRRRRIRLCCDELNMLVPFCTRETDKATTLQWTSAFLKYITQVNGDCLKQEFQNTFYTKEGVHLKPSATLGPNPEH